MNSKLKFGVVVFPGSNCDRDAHYVLNDIFKQDTRFLWHKDTSIGGVDVIVLPGGFSYGDYLRAGAIARFSPIMKEVIQFAHKGGVVVGICNGFQILCEAGLLPGTLMRNASLRFSCKYVYLRVENTDTRFTNKCKSGEVLEIPIAHGEGNYIADEDTLKRLEDNRQVILRYCEHDGSITEEANPNGSMNNIAGIVNEGGNILGLMPHPERASDPVLRHTDGQKIFQSLIESFVLQEHNTIAKISG
jgi:phosphoribosylformylglycinamidine synthase I